MSTAPTLVVRFGSLGDVVLAGAVTGALAPVVFVTKPQWAEVAAALPGVQQVLRWAEDQVPTKGWRQVVDLQPRRGRACCAPGSGPRCVGYGATICGAGPGSGSRPAPPPPTVVQRYGRAAGVDARAGAWLSDASAPPRTGPIVLCPGAAHATKRWPLPRWQFLAEAIEGPLLVAGGPHDLARCRQVAGAAGARAEVLAERGFEATLAAMRSARAVVAGDTGLLHLAAACGAPVVGLFGPTTSSDGFWIWQGHGEVLERELACRPCALHGSEHCAIGDHLCMDAIAAADVLAALERVR